MGVVPAIIVLTVLPTIFGENKPQLEFGARVEQAKNLCTNRRNCRFGYTFGRDRDLSTSESKNLQNSLTQKRTRVGNEEISRRRVPRVRIDPRRRKNEEKQVPVAEAEDPVTIKIGGVPIVIPDFDLNPAKAGGQNKLVESTLKRPESDKKRRRNRFQTKRKNNSRNKNRTTISFKAATPTIAETKSSSRLTTTTSPASRPRPTTTTSPATRSRLSTTAPPASRPRPTSTTSPASRPRLSTTTTPASKPVTNTLFTTLTSFDSLQQTVENAASPPVKFSTLFTTLSLTGITPTQPPVPRTTITTRTERGRITKKHRQTTQTPSASTSRNVFPSTNTTERYQNKECPESLEKCVDACVPLQDIYAYSACVVECGERCPVVLD